MDDNRIVAHSKKKRQGAPDPGGAQVLRGGDPWPYVIMDLANQCPAPANKLSPLPSPQPSVRKPACERRESCGGPGSDTREAHRRGQLWPAEEAIFISCRSIKIYPLKWALAASLSESWGGGRRGHFLQLLCKGGQLLPSQPLGGPPNPAVCS